MPASGCRSTGPSACASPANSQVNAAGSDHAPQAGSMPEVVPVRQKDALGQHGEQLAAQHLEENGFRVLDRNYRCAEGELDIVAAEHRTLVAVEVKTRSGLRYGTPLEAVTPQKRRRLRRLAVHWVVSHGV